jgi:hypothetical protein
MRAIKYLLIFTIPTLLLISCAKEPSLLDMEEWDLVWISDSSGWRVAEVYAQMIEQDTGVKVNVHDNWIGGLAAGDVLHGLQGTPTPSMQLARNADEIREAEVIVIYGNPSASWAEDNPADWMCVSVVGQNYVNNCDMSTFDQYISDLKAIYEIIFELREGKPTIVRAFDAYNPLIARFEEQGVYEECKACWANYNAAIHQAAEAFNVPVAEVAAAWNGPDFDQDPVAKGYTKDGEHPNEEGVHVIAETIRTLGYAPVVP